MSKIKDPSAALIVINKCLQTEARGFWVWVDDNVPKGELLALSGAARNHVYAQALRAVGFEIPERGRERYVVGDSIVDDEAAYAVCCYYINEEEVEDFENFCDENDWERNSLAASSHIYPTACRAVGSWPSK